MNTILRRFDPFSRDVMPYRSALLCLSVLLLAAPHGCATQGGPKISDGVSRESKSRLRAELAKFAEYSAAMADRAVKESRLKEHPEKVDSWRSRMTEKCHTAISRDNPVQGLVDVWMFCRRALDYFETGEGAAGLGESQPVVVDAARRVLHRIRTIAALFLEEKVYQDMRKEVIKQAGENPILGTFDVEFFTETEPWNAVGDVLWSLFTMPLRALSDFAQVTVALQGLPGTTDRIGNLLEETPRRMREEAEALLDRVETSQPELRKTLFAVRDTAKSIENTTAGVPEAAEALKSLADAVSRVTEEIGILSSNSDAADESASSQEREPFSLQEVTESAVAWKQTAAEWRKLVRDIRDFLEPDPPSGGMGAEIRRVVTHAAVWAVLLMVLLFVLLLLYRAVTNRFRAAHPSP